jgi:hypothetical protein
MTIANISSFHRRALSVALASAMSLGAAGWTSNAIAPPTRPSPPPP